MANLIQRLCMAAALSLFASCTQNNSASERKSSRPNLPQRTGKETFEQKCAPCHGADGSAGIAKAANLQLTGKDSLEMITIIKNGVRSMPAFHGELNEHEIASVAAYVKTLRTISQ